MMNSAATVAFGLPTSLGLWEEGEMSLSVWDRKRWAAAVQGRGARDLPEQKLAVQV
jgi:hypothetical protein